MLYGLFLIGGLACGVVLTTQVALNKQLGEHLQAHRQSIGG